MGRCSPRHVQDIVLSPFDLEGNEFNIARFSCEFDEISVFRTFTNNREGDFKFHTGFDGEVEALPSNLARSRDKTIAFNI